MFKSTLSALVAALLLSPGALAEDGRKVTLKHEYDTRLLASDEGTGTLLTELTRAAKRACTSRVPGLGSQHTDRACADMLVSAAVKTIHAEQSAMGAEMAPAFERIALTRLAAAD